MVLDGQVRLEDVNEEYAAFVEKFKPKKTTDDCYTPENVYNAVRDWACREYGIEPLDARASQRRVDPPDVGTQRKEPGAQQ